MSELGRSPRLIGAALLLAAFIAGAAVGFAFDRVVRPGPGLRTFVVSDMSGVLDRLELSTQQRAKADSILQRRAPTTERMMLDVADRLRELSDSVDSELREILTPQQRARLDSLRGERKLMLKRQTTGAGGTTVVDTVFSQQDNVRRK